MTATEYQPQPVKFTDNAASKVREIIDEEGDSDLMLRVYIEGGGCSGFKYGFDLTKEQQADDMVIEKNSVKLLIDFASFQYLVGAEIDYVVDMNGEQFVIRNPNAKTTCGCGSSFSTE